MILTAHRNDTLQQFGCHSALLLPHRRLFAAFVKTHVRVPIMGTVEFGRVYANMPCSPHTYVTDDHDGGNDDDFSKCSVVLYQVCDQL